MKRSKGFTLIELIVVIAILGILAGIAIPRFMDAQAAARGSKIVADLRTIDSAATIYYAKNGQYPDAISTASPAATDGFISSNLAAWPVPNAGTFIVPQLTGGAKTFKDITATYYTLTADGRAEYDGHPVEYYLGQSEGSTLIAALEALLSKADSTLSILLKKNVKNIDSENTSNKTDMENIENELKGLGVDITKSSWALRFSNNTIMLYITDHKLTYNSDRGKTVKVQIYTGTVAKDQATTWSGPVNGTAQVVAANGNGYYAKLNV